MGKGRSANGFEAKGMFRERCRAGAPPFGTLIMAATLAMLSVATVTVPSVVAQDAWVFNQSIPCSTAPVTGVPFNNCSVSNMRSFRVGNARAWRMLFSDATSEAAFGLYRLVEPKGVGGMGPLTSSMADWLRNADSLRTVTAGSFGWTQNNQYVAFQRPNRHCVGFARTGPPPGGTVYWILGGALCRDSPTPIPPAEAQFLVTSVQVRD